LIARFFIERPVLANVIAIVMLVLGAVSVFQLPVAQYPQLTPPTIQVTTSYPGASALAVQQQVARAIEQQVNGVEGMIYMQSNASSDGRYALVVSFAVGTDPDQAQVAVQNRVNIALPTLPASVQQQGVVTKKKSTAILQIVTLSSNDPAQDALFLSNFASLRVRDHLARLPGVADVNVFGLGAYSMRVWLNAEQMNQRGLNPASVINVINQQNQNVTASQTGAPPAPAGQQLQLTVNVDAPITTPEQFGKLIVNTAPDGSITHLHDVARIELGSNTYNQGFRFDGKPAGGLAIYQTPDANALDTAKAVRSKMALLAANFPAGLAYDIPFDTTVFVNASIDEVYTTLFEAGALVLVVIVVFLQNWRATLVPATTVPITIIGAFACMAALGFSINLLTLFALVLCIGIVVDDAIVVVESVAHYIEMGKTPKQAAIDAMKELIGPIIGITLVLTAVFLPAAFIPGITGQMYRQFALVIAATAVLSGINAITLKPTQSAQYLKPLNHIAKPHAFARVFNAGLARLEAAYVRLIRVLLRHPRLSSSVAGALIAAGAYGFVTVPTGFIPTEDQGYMMVAVQLPNAASLQRTELLLQKIANIAADMPAVAHTITIAGVSPLDGNASLSSAGLVYITLKDWKERGKGQDLRSLYTYLSEAVTRIPEGDSVRVLVPPPINGLGLSGGFQMQLQLVDGSGDYQKLNDAAQALVKAASADPRILLAFTSLRVNVPQLALRFNRTRAESLGVSVSDAYNTISTYLGSAYVNQFPKFGQNFTVYVQADQPFRASTEAIGRLTVRSRNGEMVPLNSFMAFSNTAAPAIASQYNLFPTATVNGAAASGHSSGEALDLLEEIAHKVLPPGVSFEWTAMSYQERLVGGAVGMVFGLALLLVYLVLAAQYESWLTPVPVMLAVPLSLVGTVGVLVGLQLPNNIYVQIGLVLLIALSAKNAILIVELAHELHQQGMDVVQAALEGSRRRFRPILMTSIAFILGVVPLVAATGAGAAARKFIGITVLSGMLASTVLAVAFVPVFFMVIARWQSQGANAAADRTRAQLAPVHGEQNIDVTNQGH